MVNLSKEPWGTIDGREMTKYTMVRGDLSVSLINLGAAVQRIVYRGMDMIVSLPEAALYDKFRVACIGATVGRYAGRIADGKIVLDGKEYRLTQNPDGNHLHGGKKGFNTRIWNGEIVESGNGSVRFTLLSPDGEEGYPGSLMVSVTYSVTDDCGLCIEYEARSDKDTVLNLTNHCYFNPNGLGETFPEHRDDQPDNSDVALMIRADRVLECNEGGIPTGMMLPVDGTPFDFRDARRLKVDIQEFPGEPFSGYDHTFVLKPHDPFQPVAVAEGLKSGVRIEFLTDQPGAQLFSLGNPGSVFALEMQHYPDSPNHPAFPTTMLRAGEVFRSKTIYRFSNR
jgi:Galactose mutarotase and related enzymes